MLRARVPRECWHSRVGHQGQAQSALEIHDQFRSAGHLVVLVIADGAGGNAIMAQELFCLAGVLAGNQIGFLQNAQGAERNVLKVADWGGDYI